MFSITLLAIGLLGMSNLLTAQGPSPCWYDEPAGAPGACIVDQYGAGYCDTFIQGLPPDCIGLPNRT